MRAVIRDNKRVYLDNITHVEEDMVASHFSVRVMNYNSYVSPDQRGSFGGVYRRYDSKTRSVARPFLADLWELSDKEGFPLVVEDVRPPWKYTPLKPEEVGPDFLPGITLTDYQLRCIHKCLKVECGIIKSPTGSGKTEMIAAICKAVPCPTLIFADILVIIDQIKERLELRQIAEEVGLFYAGKRPNGQLVIIGSISSLMTPKSIPGEPERSNYTTEALYNKAMKKYGASKKGYRSRLKNSKIFQALTKKAEMIIVDECDLATSDPYKTLFRFHCNARRRYGFSGTPFDDAKPVENLFVREHLGSVIAEVHRHEVEDAKRIIPITYWSLAFGEEGNKHDATMLELAFKEYVTENAKFHALVKGICDRYKDDGKFILVDRDALGQNLERYIPGSVFIHGKTSKRNRTIALESFEKRETKVLIGGKIVKRGLDLRGGCEVLVIASGGKMASNLKQQIGRAVRLNRKGKSEVFDFYFLNNRYLYDHSRQRLKTVVGMGYQTWVVFRNGQRLDGQQFIASRFRRPKHP